MNSKDDIIVKPIKKVRDIKSFIQLPFDLYEKDSLWVPPLKSDQLKFFNPTKNPYYSHSEVQLFLAYRGDKVVGRISAHTNKQHNLFHNDSVGFFGFFESENDQNIADKLFEKASQWLKVRNCDIIRGPMNFSVNDECGLLVTGFDTPPFIMMPHNHRYYEDLISGAGLTKVKDLFAYHLKDDKIPDRLQRISDIISKREKSIKVRSLSKKKNELRQDLVTIFTLYRKAWELNWGFVPMTNKEFDHLVETLLPIVEPEFVLIAYYEDTPVGFSVALPDYNTILKKMNGKLLPFGLLKALYYKKKIRRLRVLVMGVLKEYQRRGIDGLFYYHTFKNGLQNGYNEAEFSWILEDNTEMNNVAIKLGSTMHKTYRIFEKKLNGDS